MKLTMQIKPILCATAIFFTIFASAQDTKDFRLGVKVAPTFNWTKSKTANLDNDGLGLGFSFGLISDFKIGENYFFSPEILLSSMTCKIAFSDSLSFIDVTKKDTFFNLKRKYNIKYLEIPLTLRFRTNEIGSMRYWVQLGVSPGFLVGSNVTTTTANAFLISEKYNPNKQENDQYEVQNNQDNVRFLRASLIMGLGIEYRISGNTALQVGARFNNGFSDMLKEKKYSMINNFIALEVGVFF
jgi:hypothetical protein